MWLLLPNILIWQWQKIILEKIKVLVIFNSGIVYDDYSIVVAAELPLPSSSLSNQIALLQTQQQQVEGKQLVSQPSNQAVLIGKLLETVNNAYL